MSYAVTIDHENGRYLAVHRFDARPEEIGEKMGRAFALVTDRLGQTGTRPTGPPASCYEMDEDLFHVAAGFPVAAPVGPGDGVEDLRLPDVDTATTVHMGPYEGLAQAYDALREGAAEQGRRVDETAPVWEEYLTGPEVEPQDMCTILHWPLQPVQS